MRTQHVDRLDQFHVSTVSPALTEGRLSDTLDYDYCPDCWGVRLFEPLTGDPIFGTGEWTCRCDPWN